MYTKAEKRPIRYRHHAANTNKIRVRTLEMACAGKQSRSN